jgi:hypothetical protein
MFSGAGAGRSRQEASEPMEQANSQGQALLQQGIAAARAKRKGDAYQLLRQVVTQDPRSTEAWLWLGAVAPTAQEQLQAFEQVLALDPTNEKAQTGRRWALGRLSGGAGTAAPGAAPAPSAPPRPAPTGGGISSQDMLGMFGGGTGTTASPPPAPPRPAPGSGGSISSQDMLGMFGGSGAPPASPPGPPPVGMGSSDLAGMFGSAPAPPSPAADSTRFPSGTDTNLDLSTPQPFDPSMFGTVQAVPPAPSSPLPPGAPGTPGGAEWRGYSDLQETEAFNWDDPGLGLSSGEQPAMVVPGGTPAAARPAETYSAAPSIFSDLDRDEEATRPAVAPGAGEDMLPLQGERRGTPPLVILGAVALIILLLLVGILSALTANKTITLGAVAGPDDAVRGFLSAHVQGQTTDAARYLAPALASEYRQADSALRTGLPDPRQQRGLAARVAPLAATDTTAEVYGFFTTTATPAPETLNPGPWTFTLAKSDSGWLITGITPP